MSLEWKVSLFAVIMLNEFIEYDQKKITGGLLNEFIEYDEKKIAGGLITVPKQGYGLRITRTHRSLELYFKFKNFQGLSLMPVLAIYFES